MQGILCSILTYGYHWCIGTNAKLSKVRYKFAKKVLIHKRHIRELEIYCVQPVWPEKIAKCLLKLPKNDFTGNMIDFDSFTKIA